MAREKAGLTQTALAERVNSTKQNVAAYEQGRAEPDLEFLANVVAATGVDMDWLITGKGEMMVERRFEAFKKSVVDSSGKYGDRQIGGWAPFLGRVAADPNGKQFFDDEGIPDGAGVPFFSGNFFCLEVENDSLISAEPVSIYPGDVCIFESNRQPKNGEIVAVHLKGNERLVKILRHKGKEEVELLSANKFRNYLSVKMKKNQIASFGVFVTKLQLSEEAKRRFGLKK